jgi:2,3-diketo-5-methylthio-1-phosphopentane phosphatase
VSPANHAAIPPAAPGPSELPVAFLVDYDGTIALSDVSDMLMAEFVTAEWESRVAAYDAGRVGSRSLMEWEIGLIRADPEDLRAVAAAQPHDPGFVSFVAAARAAGALVEVVSDGFGFFIAAALDALGLPDVPIVTAATTFEGGRARIEFPNGHPRCLVCGTCKRTRVLEHQAAGRTVVFVGDGESDRYAAGHADVVFAKRGLVRICLEAAWPFHRWTEFAEIEAWLAGTLDAWAADPASLPGPASRPYFCGPEAWGPDRRDPPPGSWPPRSVARG